MVERIGPHSLPQQNGNGEGGNRQNNNELPQEKGEGGNVGGIDEIVEFTTYIRPGLLIGERGQDGGDGSEN